MARGVARAGSKFISFEELAPKACVVIGTRPGIIMFSPLIRELSRRRLAYFVVHSGQHYSYNMDKIFFKDLRLREPDYVLKSVRRFKYHGEQTAEMLREIERILLKERPRLVIVGADANTNLSGALAARKLQMRVGHLEAGERSHDWRMPEEHNRRVIDHISDLLFVTGEKSKRNLERENVQGKIYVTGNTIVDACLQNIEIADKDSVALAKLGVEEAGYFLLTTHREENVDSFDNIRNILAGIRRISKRLQFPIIFLAHPRTQNRIKEFGLQAYIEETPGVVYSDGLGYLDFIKLLSRARLVLTDSGGVQQESYILHVPCVTLRESTEWTETIETGANILAGTEPERIEKSAQLMLNRSIHWGKPFGDGKAAERIVDIMQEVMNQAW